MFLDHVTDEIEFIPIVEEKKLIDKKDGLIMKIKNRIKMRRNKTDEKS